jgi:hypothetical protein
MPMRTDRNVYPFHTSPLSRVSAPRAWVPQPEGYSVIGAFVRGLGFVVAVALLLSII